MQRCMIFTVQGQFARFRKPYTTTSALSYICVHPMAIKGMMGAILGVAKEALYDYFKEVKIGIQVINDIHKDMGSFNLTSMKTGELFRFPSNVEFLREVKYRIFLQGEEELLESLKEAMINHYYVFTPYLGASEHLAQLNFEDIAEIQSTEITNTVCVVPKSKCNLGKLDIEKVYTERLPIQNNEKREYIQYEQVVIPVLEEKIRLRQADLSRVGGYDVYFF